METDLYKKHQDLIKLRSKLKLYTIRDIIKHPDLDLEIDKRVKLETLWNSIPNFDIKTNPKWILFVNLLHKILKTKGLIE